MIGAALTKRDDFKLSHLEWATQYRKIDGADFSFDGHEYLRQIYADQHPYIVLEKAAQMGASVWAISSVLYVCHQRRGTRCIYYFPTDTDVSDFSADRMVEAIASTSCLENTKRTIDNVHLRRVEDSWLYLRGMHSKLRTKSVPADFLVFDELDESAPANKAQAIERLAHSTLGWVRELSTPSLPSYGIDIQWQHSDQHYWHTACGCKTGCVMEDHWPEVLRREQGEWVYRCPLCGKQLDPQVPARVGQYTGWVPKNPTAVIRGYHLSQLFSSLVTPETLAGKWQAANEPTGNLPEFYNSNLGFPYAGDRKPITVAQVLALCQNSELETTGAGCAIGIDQGPNQCYVVVGKREGNILRIIYLEEVESFLDPWVRVSQIVSQFEGACVIDAMPERNAARQLARQFPGRVWLAFYSTNAKQLMSWGGQAEGDHSVTLHRTELLDAVVNPCRWALCACPGVTPPSTAWQTTWPAWPSSRSGIQRRARKSTATWRRVQTILRTPLLT
jgi:hypothetical protein